MRDFLFHLQPATGGLQEQLQNQIVAAVLDGQLPPGSAVPSSRRLAAQLGIARNTVVLTYQRLVEQGFLVSRERSGYFVADELAPTARPPADVAAPGHAVDGTPVDWKPVDWAARLARHPSGQRNISKPADWRAVRYNFIYGQVDPSLFPLAAWRNCSRQALSRSAVDDWSADHVTIDDPLLIEQLRARVLPRRGVRAQPDEILLTMGAQNALWLLASLLLTRQRTVALEEPGYVDVRNIVALRGARLAPVPVDAGGLDVAAIPAAADYVYVTPSHQSPTTVTLSMARRQALLRRAAADDFAIIEDDYEGEMNYVGEPTPALKSLDRDGRVLYVGSLSKYLAPGLRLGYLVGPAPLIAEARQLRRLMYRHPPSNNQRTLALFLAGGHYDSLLARLHRIYRRRWQVLGAALARHLPRAARTPAFGGSSFWVEGPPGLDAAELAARALPRGVLIEPGEVHYLAARPTNCFRLGFSSIPEERIEPGIELLAELIDGG